jgi:hypothetical protein
MKNYRYIFAGLVVIIVCFVAWWLHNPNMPAPSQPTVANATNTVMPSPANISTTNPPIVVSNTSGFTNEADLGKAYKEGLINKGELMHEAMLIRNIRVQDFYGKVIDQYGQPVAGVNVTGNLFLEQGYDADEKREAFKTLTDAGGLFQFTGLHGSSLGVTVAKEGYEMGQGVGFYEAPNKEGETIPTERAIFKMWKLKGPEPMTRANIHAYIPCDGSVTRYDLLTGKKNASGDLAVQLTRNPVDIDRGKPFDWSIVLEISNGGLQEVVDLYPNEAPADGYKTTIATNFPADMPKWTPSFDNSYYFEAKNGQVFGRININFQADFQPPPTLFDAEIYANPSGSRNLEFDQNKWINR